MASRFEFTFKTAIAVSISNLAVSVIFSTLATHFDRLAMLVYISIIVLILIGMTILYTLSYSELSRRAKRSRHRSVHLSIRPETTDLQSPNAVEAQSNRAVGFSVPVINIEPLTPSNDPDKPVTAPVDDEKIQGPELEKVTAGMKLDLKDSLMENSSGRLITPNSCSENRTHLKENKSQAAHKSQMELMTVRSAKVFATITAVYIVCFLPCVILTVIVFGYGEEFIITPKPKLVEIIMRYGNSVFNFNFIIMPVIYVSLSPQFSKDFKQFANEMRNMFSDVSQSFRL